MEPVYLQKNNKWGYFPSVAAGWTLSEEDFMKNINWLSNLKLRLSWGQTGNADISTNAFASYGAQGSWINSEYKTISGVMKSRLENPDLKWGNNYGMESWIRLRLSKKPYHRFSGTLPKSDFGFAELQTSKFLPRSKTNNG